MRLHCPAREAEPAIAEEAAGAEDARRWAGAPGVFQWPAKFLKVGGTVQIHGGL